MPFFKSSNKNKVALASSKPASAPVSTPVSTPVQSPRTSYQAKGGSVQAMSPDEILHKLSKKTMPNAPGGKNKLPTSTSTPSLASEPLLKEPSPAKGTGNPEFQMTPKEAMRKLSQSMLNTAGSGPYIL
ncbi:hypothetical protein BGX31_003669 [Mortierella sp. GBA43]|nr:hypothetical protein BGX31_003669 [Mortierella sp. GBA43]